MNKKQRSSCHLFQQKIQFPLKGTSTLHQRPQHDTLEHVDILNTDGKWSFDRKGWPSSISVRFTTSYQIQSNIRRVISRLLILYYIINLIVIINQMTAHSALCFQIYLDNVAIILGTLTLLIFIEYWHEHVWILS